MSSNGYENLFAPMQIGNVSLKNRIMSSAHQTSLTEDHLPTEDFVAYHLERAKGGVGLIVLEAHAAHPTAINTPLAIDGTNPGLVDWHSELVDRAADTGVKIFAQLLHNGSEAYTESYAEPVVAPSAVPTERFHLMPRELEDFEFEEIIESFALTAKRLREAGLDGVELGGAHGYLFAQFWSPRTNLRTDKWGGSFENRMRFSEQTARRVREEIGDEMALGMRISIGSADDEGLTEEESLEIVDYLSGLGLIDYWSVVVGSSRTYEGSSYIVPPASEPEDIALKKARQLRELTGKPLIVTSRITSAEFAEEAIKEGYVDVVGMTRALIAEPELPNKLARNTDFIVPCIAVNQGCIGRYQEHLPIRCTVNPRTGRERVLAQPATTASPKNVLIVGGGPAGLTAALEASRRGHQVKLVEQQAELGGQMLLSLEVSHKRYFPDWPKAVGEQLDRLGVEIVLGERFTPDNLAQEAFDAVVIASGCTAHIPQLPLQGKLRAVTAREVLSDGEDPPGPVMVIDWESKWSGIEAAETLAKQGLEVEIVSASYGIAEGVQQYIRTKALARLDTMGVSMTPGYKLKGVEGDRVLLQHAFSRRPVERSGFESIVLCYGGDADDSLKLYREIREQAAEVYRIGDALGPRTLEEAIWEGYKVADEVLV